MSLSAAEQYLLELMNRARLNPGAEAARFGIDLNKDLAPGAITAAAKAVLAPNAMLEAAATLHARWMLANDIFSHTGAAGSDAGQRIMTQGYIWSTYCENIAYVGTTGALTLETAIGQINQNLFLSAGHRANLLNANFREVGLGAETGVFISGGVGYNAAMVTEDFGTTGSGHFLTGVAYTDINHDNFYSIGEGVAGVRFGITGASTVTADVGGYAVATGAAVTAVFGQSGTLYFNLRVDMSAGNVKLDLVGGTVLLSSGSMTLGAGINNAQLLGVAALTLGGNGVANHLTGNLGANLISGFGGDDTLSGLGGNDNLGGGPGADSLSGGLGFDILRGAAGDDILTGGLGADAFVFTTGAGSDRITDFKLGEHDVLRFDDALWTGIRTAHDVMTAFAHVGTGEVVFDFGAGNQVHLAGLTSLAGLEAQLQIF